MPYCLGTVFSFLFDFEQFSLIEVGVLLYLERVDCLTRRLRLMLDQKLKCRLLFLLLRRRHVLLRAQSGRAALVFVDIEDGGGLQVVLGVLPECRKDYLRLLLVFAVGLQLVLFREILIQLIDLRGAPKDDLIIITRARHHMSRKSIVLSVGSCMRHVNLVQLPHGVRFLVGCQVGALSEPSGAFRIRANIRLLSGVGPQVSS